MISQPQHWSRESFELSFVLCEARTEQCAVWTVAVLQVHIKSKNDDSIDGWDQAFLVTADNILNETSFYKLRFLNYCILALKERLTKAELHPDWDGDISRGYDFALLKLNESSTTQFIQPINEDFELTTDCLFSALGWGRLSERGPFAPVLQVAEEMPYYPPDFCSNFFDRSPDKLLCAGDGSSDSCAGMQWFLWSFLFHCISWE